VWVWTFVKLAVSSGVLSVGHGPEQGALCHRADEARRSKVTSFGLEQTDKDVHKHR